MLFNSYEFLFVFLPLTLIVFFLLGKRIGPEAAMLWLVAASLGFYGWWNPVYLWLIVFSMFFNYWAGLVLRGRVQRKAMLVIGIAANLGLLGYFKYANFFVDTVNDLAGTSYNLQNIVLPLAISFFTFQQIAYLVDAYQRKTEEHNFRHYALFVVFFPQLIAGPIVHHGEMMRQFARPDTFRLHSRNLELGLTILSLGLFKKVMLADSIAQYSTPVFQAVSSGSIITVYDAWVGALGYTFQLYFDFSAYSDMAIGTALMFGIRLPVNFNSPYKAVNIVDFWRRWHMTLSRFLRDYVYISLGGNRKGRARRYINLMVTMLLGGLWHGAGWTFVLWGGLHGGYLIINHAWHRVRRLLGQDLETSSLTGRFLSTLVTFMAVVVGWVYFRAENMDTANMILSTMFGGQHVTILGSSLFSQQMIYEAGAWIISLSVLVWLMPNVLETVGYMENRHDWRRYRWMPDRLAGLLEFKLTIAWALFSSALLLVAILNLTGVSEFLYFQF